MQIEGQTESQKVLAPPEDSTDQFNIIENFLRTLAIGTPQKEDAGRNGFADSAEKDEIDLNKMTRISYTPNQDL